LINHSTIGAIGEKQFVPVCFTYMIWFVYLYTLIRTHTIRKLKKVSKSD